MSSPLPRPRRGRRARPTHASVLALRNWPSAAIVVGGVLTAIWLVTIDTWVLYGRSGLCYVYPHPRVSPTALRDLLVTTIGTTAVWFEIWWSFRGYRLLIGLWAPFAVLPGWVFLLAPLR